MTEPFLGMPRPELANDGVLRVGNASSGGLVCRSLVPLETRWARFRQSWGHNWQDGEALLLSPADAVHSFGAPKAGLRIHFLDEAWHVIQSCALPRRRAQPCPDRTAAALIQPASAPAIPVGERLEVLGAQPRLPQAADGEYPSDV